MKEVNSKKTTKAASNPSFIGEEGTIYRVILSLFCEDGKTSYSQIGRRLQRMQIDSGLGHSTALSNNLAIYLDKDHEDLKSLGYNCSLFLSAGISQDISMKYDNLSLTQYCQVVEHVHHWYKVAVRNNTKSGVHETFPNYVQERYWLMLMRSMLLKTGNENLQMISYPELPHVLTSSLGSEKSPIEIEDFNSSHHQKIHERRHETNNQGQESCYQTN